MKRERGLVAGLGLYAALAAGAVILGMGLWIKIQGSALERCRTQHAKFVAEVKAQGELAQKEADAENARLRKAKESADETAKRLVADLNATRERLRHTGGSLARLVSRASETTGTTDPTRACYRRDPLSDAVQRFVEGVSGIVTEGDDFRIDSVVAKGWIRDVTKK